MTDLKERLDRLATEATTGLALTHPADRLGPAGQTDQRRPSRPLVALVALVVVGLAGGSLLWRGGGDETIEAGPGGLTTLDRGEPAEGQRPVELLAVFRRPRTEADELPPAMVERLEDPSPTQAEPGLDLSASRAGPTLGETRIWAIPTVDGAHLCSHVALADGPDHIGGSSCMDPGRIVITGDSGGWLSGAGQGLVYGHVADDVIGVEVDGEPAAFEDGMFVAAGGEYSTIELIRQPERAALVEACDALAVVTRPDLIRDPVTVLGENDAAMLVAMGEVGDPNFDRLVEFLGGTEPWPDDDEGVDELTGVLRSTADRCTSELVPGWAVVYRPLVPAIGVPAPTIDLEDYGRLHELRSTTMPIAHLDGPLLTPVTRVEVADTGLVVFVWLRAGPNLLVCAQVAGDGWSQSSCEPSDLGGTGLVMGLDRVDLQLHVVPNDRRAAFATAARSGGGETRVQAASGEYFVFAVPSESFATIVTLHDEVGHPIG